LHPDFSVRMWEAMGCAPLVVTGPKLDAVRRRVKARAVELETEVHNCPEEGAGGAQAAQPEPAAIPAHATGATARPLPAMARA
jgi:hypothetical protein